MQKNIAEEEIRAEMKAAEARKNTASSKRQPSHLSLLAGAIKRKTSEEDRTPNTSTAAHPKRQKTGLCQLTGTGMSHRNNLAFVVVVIVALYKGKGIKEECNNYRGISLLSVPGQMYGSLDRESDGSN